MLQRQKGHREVVSVHWCFTTRYSLPDLDRLCDVNDDEDGGGDAEDGGDDDDAFGNSAVADGLKEYTWTTTLLLLQSLLPNPSSWSSKTVGTTFQTPCLLWLCSELMAEVVALSRSRSSTTQLRGIQVRVEKVNVLRGSLRCLSSFLRAGS